MGWILFFGGFWDHYRVVGFSLWVSLVFSDLSVLLAGFWLFTLGFFHFWDLSVLLAGFWLLDVGFLCFFFWPISTVGLFLALHWGFLAFWTYQYFWLGWLAASVCASGSVSVSVSCSGWLPHASVYCPGWLFCLCYCPLLDGCHHRKHTLFCTWKHGVSEFPAGWCLLSFTTSLPPTHHHLGQPLKVINISEISESWK